MKLLELYLEGYVGIQVGLGLPSIRIDFSKCKNNITMIVGDNGSGKSTLLRAMNPLPESNAAFVHNKSAQKVISYIDNDGTIYRINYVHPFKDGKRETTKGYIQKSINGEFVELNPNGNVSSCKDILYTELGLDSNFVSLSEIGCENRGLAMKRPAERKQYINYILENLEVYNNIYKTLNKKSSTYKSMISSITSKLSNLGDPQILQNSLLSVNKRIDEINKERDRISSDISKANTTISLIDPDGSIQTKAEDLTKQLSQVNTALELKRRKFEDLKKNFPLEINENTRSIIERDILKEESSIELIQNKLDDIVKSGEKDTEALQQKQAKLNQLSSDEVFEKTQKEFDAVTSQIEEYEKTMNEIGLTNKSISSAEFISGVTAIQEISNTIDSLKNSFDYSIIQRALEPRDTINEQEVCSIELEDMNEQLSNIENVIVFNHAKLDMIKVLDSRPSNCNIDDCPFIANALEESTKGYDEKLEGLYEQKSQLEHLIYNEKNRLKELKAINGCKVYINIIIQNINTTKSILTKLPGGEVFSDSKVFFQNLFNGNTFKEARRLTTYIDMANILDLYNNAIKYRYELEKSLKEFSYKKQIIDEILIDIENINNNLNEKTKQISTLESELKDHRNKLITAQLLLNDFNDLEVALTEHSELTKKQKTLSIEGASIESDMRKITELLKQILELEKKQSGIPSIAPMLEERDKLVHSIKLLEDYNNELREYNDKYNKVETIKYYSSPTSGIQLIFLNLYMNKILSLANELLSTMFNGELEILPFIINEKEFKIPCRFHGGIPCDDITSMSNSQICMISTVIQFALLYQSSTKLNIPRMDEIDSGLDSYNSSLFVLEFVDNLMSNLNVQQTILISHTNEIMFKDIDVILLKNINCQKEITGNIIYSV